MIGWCGLAWFNWLILSYFLKWIDCASASFAYREVLFSGLAVSMFGIPLMCDDVFPLGLLWPTKRPSCLCSIPRLSTRPRSWTCTKVSMKRCSEATVSSRSWVFYTFPWRNQQTVSRARGWLPWTAPLKMWVSVLPTVLVLFSSSLRCQLNSVLNPSVNRTIVKVLIKEASVGMRKLASRWRINCSGWDNNKQPCFNLLLHITSW